MWIESTHRNLITSWRDRYPGLSRYWVITTLLIISVLWLWWLQRCSSHSDSNLRKSDSIHPPAVLGGSVDHTLISYRINEIREEISLIEDSIIDIKTRRTKILAIFHGVEFDPYDLERLSILSSKHQKLSGMLQFFMDAMVDKEPQGLQSWRVIGLSLDNREDPDAIQ